MSTSLIAALAAYADMLADPDVPSEKIAELAGVDVAEVFAARGATAQPGPAPEPEPEPKVPPKGKKPAKAEPKAAPPPAPASVRARKRAMIIGPNGRTLQVKRFDVFNGERAAWMWAHHPDLVELL